MGPHYLKLDQISHILLVEPKNILKNILHQFMLKWTQNYESIK